MSDKRKDSNIPSVKTVMYSLFLTIAGAIIWELIHDKLLPGFVSLFGFFSSSFIDHLYSFVPSAVTEDGNILASDFSNGFIIAACVLSGYYVFKLSRKQFREAANLKERISALPDDNIEYPYPDETPLVRGSDDIKKDVGDLFERTRQMYQRGILTIVLFWVFAAILLIFSFSADFAHTTAINTLQNIDIVAPYISDHDHKVMLSDFYQISSKTDYDSLMKSIYSVANENGLSLKQ